MRILGIDPGLGATGYAAIDAESGQFKLLEAGIIKNSPRVELYLRLAKIYKAVTELVSEYKPDFLVLEKLYSHYKHQMTAISMAHARGVIVLAVDHSPKLQLINYSAKRVKKALTGNGNASKAQVQRTVQSIMKLNKLPAPLDVSDALGLAIAHEFIERGNK